MTKFISSLLLFVLAGCASQQQSPKEVELTENFDSVSAYQLLEDGAQTLTKNALKAKRDYFDKIISMCVAAFSNSEQRYYTTRTTTESLMYMLKSAAEEEDASIIQVPCGEAHYLAAYASVDLGNVDAALAHLDRARHWSPMNSVYTSEIGHIRQLQRNWSEALSLFTEAEEHANTFSPDETKITEETRAKRGMGYALIELGRLDEAEVKYLECLALDKDDAGAKHQLEYIAHLRSK